MTAPTPEERAQEIVEACVGAAQYTLLRREDRERLVDAIAAALAQQGEECEYPHCHMRDSTGSWKGSPEWQRARTNTSVVCAERESVERASTGGVRASNCEESSALASRSAGPDVGAGEKALKRALKKALRDADEIIEEPGVPPKSVWREWQRRHRDVLAALAGSEDLRASQKRPSRSLTDLSSSSTGA